MTFQLALDEVYGTTDEQDDLDPATVGGLALLRQAFTTGAAVLSHWKFPNGQRLRFRSFEQEDFVVGALRLGNISSQSGRSVTIDNYTVALGSLKNGQVLLTATDGTTFESVVASSSGPDLTLVKEPDSSFSGGSYELRSSYYEYGLSGFARWELLYRPVEWLGVYDVDNDVPLELNGPFERFESLRGIAGTPTGWSKFGKGIFMNAAPGMQGFLVTYLRNPVVGPELTDDLSDLPEAFHDCLVQWCRHWAFTRGGDVVAAKDAWNKLGAMLTSIRSQYDFETDYASDTLKFI